MSDELKNRIKEAPISHVLGHYLTLHKRGPNTLAICPFHDDKNPSMHVNDQKNMFMCFVDNIGGDAISFVMRYSNLTFPEAIKDICDKMGWDYEEYAQQKKQSPKFELGKKILNKTCQLYRRIAKTGSYAAFDDFIKNRSIGEEGANDYQLGFSPSDNALSSYLHSIKDQSEKQNALDLALELGLIRDDKYQKGSHYDTFRDRVMFPIWDQFGQVNGFTSRAVNDSQKAKYINSIDSFLFNKRNILYGLHFAKSYIRQRNSIIIVEGNMDQLTLNLNGFENSVAIMGVALSEYSFKVLKSLTPNFFFALDNDQAGHKAMERINILCMENGVIPKYIDLSPHKDPDDFILKEGALTFTQRMDESKTYLEYLLQQTLPDSIPQNLDRKLEILQKIFKVLSPLGEGVRASEHIAEYAKKLGLRSDSSQLNKNYIEFLKEENKQASPYSKNNTTHTKVNSTQSRNNAEAPHGNIPENNYIESNPFNDYPDEYIAQDYVETVPELGRAEKSLLQTLIQHPECLTCDEMSEILDFVTHNEVKEYILKLKNLIYEIDESEYKNFITRELESNQLSLELKETVGAAIFKYQQQDLEEKTIKKILKDLKLRVQKENLKSEKVALTNKFKECVDESETKHIIAALNDIDKKILNLK